MNEYGEEVTTGPRIVRKKTYPLTMLLGGVGLAIGVVAVVLTLNKAKGVPAANRASDNAKRAEMMRDAIALRKEEFTAKYRRIDDELSGRLTFARKQESPTEVRDLLLDALEDYPEGANGPKASEELQRVFGTLR